MNVSLSKFTDILREYGTLLSTYVLFDLIDAIGEEVAIFSFKLIFYNVNKFDSKMAQLLILRQVKRHKIINRSNFLILIKRKKEVSDYATSDGDDIF